jgi:hypothetical protein
MGSLALDQEPDIEIEIEDPESVKMSIEGEEFLRCAKVRALRRI